MTLTYPADRARPVPDRLIGLDQVDLIGGENLALLSEDGRRTRIEKTYDFTHSSHVSSALITLRLSLAGGIVIRRLFDHSRRSSSEFHDIWQHQMFSICAKSNY